MTELLQQVKDLQRTEQTTAIRSCTSNDLTCDKSLNGGKSDDLDICQKKGAPKANTKPAGAEGTFLGMRKGFLLNSRGDSRPKTRETGPQQVDVPVLKQRQDDSLVLGEVQEKISKVVPLLSGKDWVTDDLLNKLEKHPHLKELLADPRFHCILGNFEKDPKMARTELQKNPELCRLFMEFCSLMGDHFTALAGQSAAGPLDSHCHPLTSRGSSGVRTREEPGAEMTVRSSTDPIQLTAQDEAAMERILSDPEVQEAFTDIRIKKLVFETIQNDPQQAQRIFRSASPEMKRKIRKLVDVGLLGVQP